MIYLPSFIEKDEPPQSKAGQNVVLHLPTDEVTLDGRESTDDHAIIHYEWTLLQGDPSVDMKVIHVAFTSGNWCLREGCSPLASEFL